MKLSVREISMYKITIKCQEYWKVRAFQKLLLYFLTTITFFSVSHLSPNNAFAQDNAGKVIGVVIDSETGEGLIGANIYFEGTTLGAASDLDGSFFISPVPPGQYTLIVQMISYASLKLTEFQVSPGETKKIEITLEPEALTTEEVVVEARMLRNNEATLLKERQKAIAVSDAISAEAITRSGSGNAAEAMTKVTGASVVDGKYVYIRGLGERYSATMLNGAELPSADPEKKAVQMDLFPSNLLDNIVTIKTFTPDKPGNFSGGIVDVGTKSYPDKYTLKFSASTDYNPQVTFNTDYLTYLGSDSDWRGKDDGLRALPQELQQNPIPSDGASVTTRRDPVLASQLDRATKSLTPIMAPLTDRASIDRNFALSIGNQRNLFGRSFGYLASLSYKQNFSYYDGGQTGRWQLGTSVAETEVLNPRILLDDTKGTEEALWGGLFTASSKLHNNHELTTNIFYTQSGESFSRYLIGNWPEQFGPTAINTFFETRVLGWVERNLQSYQLSGDHFLPSVLETKIDWQVALTKNTQEEPDSRFFSNHFTIRPLAGTDRDTILYSITPSNYSQPARYFRDLAENGFSTGINFTTPFKSWNRLNGKFKLGGLYSEKNREFREIRYQYERPPALRYLGDPYDFFSESKTGIVDFDSTRNEFVFGNYIQLSPDPRGGDYDGNEKITAAYVMIDIPLSHRLRFIGGVRFESTRMDVLSLNESKADSLRFGELREDDWLPSINVIYQLSDNMNFRLAYGRTLARPTLREMAPYSNFEFVNDYVFTGNPKLKRTIVDNFDLRWEWFDRPGEIYAISGFYKIFENPIERTIIGASSADNPEITFSNVDKGTTIGLEFEARKRLDIFHSVLSNFQLGFNLSLVHSQVDIPKEKLDKLIERDPDRVEFKDDTRPLQGQSPFLLNVDFAYDNVKFGTALDIQYNVFGDRLSDVTSDATPDVFEKSRSVLNIGISQKLINGLSLKISAKNLFDSPIKFAHDYRGNEYVRREYKVGRAFSLGVSYDVF